MYERNPVKEYEWPYNLLEAIGMNPDDPLDHMSTEGELELAMCMSRLTDREKLVIRERYFKQQTLKEVGKVIGTAQERARQIEAKAVRKLRHPYSASGIILRHGAKAYIEGLVEEQVKARMQIKEAELEEAYQKKMKELELGEDVVQAIDEHKNRMAIPVEELDLSVRAYNCLTRAGCRTVGDIVTNYPNYDDACKIRNFGRRSMNEVSDKLSRMGIVWPREVG